MQKKFVNWLMLVMSMLQANTLMVGKSSENENKVFDMNVERSLKSGRNHRKDHESGRDEVASIGMGILFLFNAVFPFFYLLAYLFDITFF